MNNIPKILIVGVVRNCQQTFEKEFDRLLKSCKSLNVVGSYFVESDSTDNTLSVLESTRNRIESFEFESLGHLNSVIPHRIHRIRYCRNQYVTYIRKNYSSADLDFIVVADMDGINSALTKSSIESCLKYDDWDGIFSNQLFGISDLLALRAPKWMESDFIVELESARRQLRILPEPKSLVERVFRFFAYDKTRVNVIYDRMRYIGFRKKLVAVDSAFGGIGIYRTWCFLLADYSEERDVGICEHISFHKQLTDNGAKLFINPRFINSIFNTYNINKFFIVRNLRLWRWNRNKS
jgi:hypothetical protein